MRSVFLSFVIALSSLSLLCEAPATLGDLDPKDRVTLSREELVRLLPGARLKRFSARGSPQDWTNRANGTLTATSEYGGKIPLVAEGKWRITDEGRFCVRIEWPGYDPEDWCRLIVKSGGKYFAVDSDQDLKGRLRPFEIIK